MSTELNLANGDVLHLQEILILQRISIQFFTRTVLQSAIRLR